MSEVQCYYMIPPLLTYRATTEELISTYDEEQGMFMESTTLIQFKKRLPVFTATDSAPARKIPVIMKLQNIWGDKTLKDLTVLIQRLGVPGKYLHISKVSTSSIAVHWLCPADMIQELEEAITAAADSFCVEGVEQISIGGRLVLDFSGPAQGVVIILCSSFEFFLCMIRIQVLLCPSQPLNSLPTDHMILVSITNNSPSMFVSHLS